MITNKYEPPQKHRLRTVSKKLHGGGWGLNWFYGIPTSPSASVMAQNIQLFGPREGFLTHQWIITGDKQTKDKYYDETKMRTRQKQRVATDVESRSILFNRRKVLRLNKHLCMKRFLLII